MPTNFYTIRERVCDEWYPKAAAVLRGTVDSGDTDTLVDAAAALPASEPNHYDGGWIKIRQTTDNLAPQGEVRAIDNAGFTVATGSFETVAFGATLTAADDYEIHREWHPGQLDTIANRLLRGLYMPSFFPLTLDLQGSDDNDMEASGVTGWTGGTATPTKSSTAYNGAQSITLTGSGALDYVTAGNFNVVAGESYYTAVMCQVDDGDSARVRMFNSTGSATIQDSGDTTQTGWMEIIMQWAAPSGCRAAQAQLMCVANTDVARWDDYQVWANDAHVYPCPSWITRKDQVLGVYAYPEGTGGPVTDTFIADEMMKYPVSFRFDRADVRADTPLYIWVPALGRRRPYIYAHKPLTEVSFDYGSAGVGAGALGSPANTIPFNTSEADALVKGVLGELYRLSLNDPNVVGERWRQAKALAADYMEQYKTGLNHLRPEWRDVIKQSNRSYGTIGV